MDEKLNIIEELNVARKELNTRNKELTRINEELSKKVREQEKLIKFKNDMIMRYSHSWRHISYPEIVKEVAEKLLKDEKYKAYANKLMRAYDSEIALKHQSEMLVLRHSSSTEEVQYFIKKGLASSQYDEGITILDIIEFSLDRIIFGILINEEDKFSHTHRRKIELGNMRGIEELKKDYIDKFIIKSSSESVIQWFKDNIYNFDIEICGYWKDIKIKKYTCAEAFLIEIFTELIYNAINYGGKQEGFINLDLSEKEEGHENYLHIKILNPIEYVKVFNKGTGKGLSSLSSLLNIVNHKDNEEREENNEDKYLKSELTTQYGVDVFSVELFIRKELYVKRELNLSEMFVD